MPVRRLPRAVTKEALASQRIFVDAKINGKPVHFQFDTGADLSQVSQATAQQLGLSTAKPISYYNVTGVSGSSIKAPLIAVTMQIGTTAPFPAQILVAPSQFNLIARRDVTQRYEIRIGAGGAAKLVPLSGKTPAATQNLSLADPTTQKLMLAAGVGLVAIILIK